jgi:hypothetical protein
MQLIQSRTVSHLVHDVAWLLRDAPQTPSRDGSTRELEGPVVCSVSEPSLHVPLNPGRQGNPWVTLAEWPWLVAGRNDVAWLLPYLPRAGDFSDDGETWRAGYGPRLRSWGGHGYDGTSILDAPTDQLQELVARLKVSRGTRQAVMSLWDPDSDNMPGSKDYPCTNWFQALIRNERLNLHVVMRSNDLIWGLSGVNLYNWTMLQELLAACTSSGIGTYTHTAGSLHVYERHFERLKAIAGGSSIPDVPPTPGIPAGTALTEYTEQCRSAVDVVEHHRGVSAGDTHRLVTGLGELRPWARFMLLHSWLGEPNAPWSQLTDAVDNPEWLLLLLEYLHRTARMQPDVVREVLSERGWATERCLLYVTSSTPKG